MRSSRWIFVGLAVLVAGASYAGEAKVVGDEGWCREDGGSRERARHCEVREATLPAGGLLVVDARPNGGIEVRGSDRDDVRLRVKIVASADTPGEARALAGQVQLDTTGTIQATGPDQGRRSWWASYRLDVPRSQALRLQADNGGLHLSNLTGDVELHTVNGGLHLDEVGGHIHGQTVNGGIHVELSGSEWDGEGVELQTTNGGLHLEVPADYNARLEASTVNGGVQSDVPSTRKGRHSGGRVAVELGRGGPLLRFETTNGGLHIAQR
jgi:Putative adhesin